jgi:hypothetical protein
MPVHSLNNQKWVLGILPSNIEVNVDSPGWILLTSLTTQLGMTISELPLHLWGVTEVFKHYEDEVETNKMADSEYFSIKKSRLTFDVKFIPFLFQEATGIEALGQKYYGYLDLDELESRLSNSNLFIFGDDNGNANGIHPDWAIAVVIIDKSLEKDEKGNRILSVRFQSRWATNRKY